MVLWVPWKIFYVKRQQLLALFVLLVVILCFRYGPSLQRFSNNLNRFVNLYHDGSIPHQAIDVYMLSRTGYSQVIFKFLLGVKMQPENRSINLESDLIVTWETRDIQVFNYY
jgi:hypothetical protein